jgi:hypothetical protein
MERKDQELVKVCSILPVLADMGVIRAVSAKAMLRWLL